MDRHNHPLKILMLVNWKIRRCTGIPDDLQPPDYDTTEHPYWFYRFFNHVPQTDILDTRSIPPIEWFEKKILRFYVIQALRAIPKLKHYDLVVSHGMQSGVVLSLWRRFFKARTKHLVFEIGSFNSAAEGGSAQKLMQAASKSIDAMIYHTKSQMEYYRRYYPWLAERSHYIRFGADCDFFSSAGAGSTERYILCCGFHTRDWPVLFEAHAMLQSDVRLLVVGHTRKKTDPGEETIYIPSVPINELKRIIEEALFCVLPLAYHNYSYGQMTLLQQMSMGKCVITAKVPPMLDYVEDGVNALFYQAGEAADLAHQMKRCIENPELCDTIGHEAQRFIREECNEKVMAAEIEKVIYQTVKSQQGTGRSVSVE